MRTIEEIQSELRAMALELEQLKQTKESDNLTADFRQISANASRYPIKPHPLEGFDEHAKKCYITLLLTVARFESDTLSDSLLLAHRIAFGMEYLHKGEELQEEFNTAQTLTFAQLDEITALFKDNDERLMLILECLLTAGVFTSGRQEAMEYIAQLAVLLNVGKEELVFLSNMAGVILTGDIKNYKCKVKNEYEIFNVYLKDIDIPIKLFSWNFERIHDLKHGAGATLKTVTCSCSGNEFLLHLEYLAWYGPVNATHVFEETDNFIIKLHNYNAYKNRDSKALYNKDYITGFPVGVKSSLLCPKSFMEEYYNKNSDIDSYYV